MTQVAIVYHSGYGHTAVLAESIAEGVREAGATPVLARIETAADDFGPLVEDVNRSDAAVFGSPTYMGDVSAAFKAFAEASSKVYVAQAWKDKLAGGFTVSNSFSGDKTRTLESLAELAAQHGMTWVNLGILPTSLPAAERGPDVVNRLGGFVGVQAQADNDSPEVTPPAGDRETARLYGRRIAEAAIRWARGAQPAAAPLAA